MLVFHMDVLSAGSQQMSDAMRSMRSVLDRAALLWGPLQPGARELMASSVRLLLYLLTGIEVRLETTRQQVALIDSASKGKW